LKTKSRDAKTLKTKVAVKGSKNKPAGVKAKTGTKAVTPKVKPSKTVSRKTETVKAASVTPKKPAVLKKSNGNLARDLKATLMTRQTIKGQAMKNENEKKLKKYKPNKKTRYTAKELQHFKDIILDERNKILESAKANMESLVDDESGEYVGDNLTYASHMAEQGSDEMEREKNYMFVQRDEKYLGYLQEALVRIDQGTYGVCIDCFDDPKNLCRTCPLIPSERLELVPITQHCIECKNLRG
jgi:RNA polymerase-binding transcription factor DksA